MKGIDRRAAVGATVLNGRVESARMPALGRHRVWHVECVPLDGRVARLDRRVVYATMVYRTLR